MLCKKVTSLYCGQCKRYVCPRHVYNICVPRAGMDNHHLEFVTFTYCTVEVSEHV